MRNAELLQFRLGGSDMGRLFGVAEYGDAFTVWAQKKGGLGLLTPTDRMVVGSALEPAVLSLYTHVTGKAIDYCNETFVHPTRDYMAATPDAFCKEYRIGIDAKVIFWDQRHKWGDSPDEIPEDAQLQMAWYMAFFNYDVWEICAFIGTGLPRIYTMERDREMEKAMLARAEEFHRRYLIGDEIPPMGGSELTARWLQQAFPAPKRNVMRMASPAEAAAFETLHAVRCQIKDYTREKNRLESELRAAVGDDEGLLFDNGRFTWKKCKDSEVLNWKAYAIGLANQYVKDEAARRTLEGLYTVTKPGGRRIRFTYYGEEDTDE